MSTSLFHFSKLLSSTVGLLASAQVCSGLLRSVGLDSGKLCSTPRQFSKAHIIRTQGAIYMISVCQRSLSLSVNSYPPPSDVWCPATDLIRSDQV